GHSKLTDTLQHDGLWCALTDQSMGLLTDQYNRHYHISRKEQDQFAQLSQHRAHLAQTSGKLAEEIAPIDSLLEVDEDIRPHTSTEKLATLSPVFEAAGTITAGNASQMTDGASVGIIT